MFLKSMISTAISLPLLIGNPTYVESVEEDVPNVDVEITTLHSIYETLNINEEEKDLGPHVIKKSKEEKTKVKSEKVENKETKEPKKKEEKKEVKKEKAPEPVQEEKIDNATMTVKATAYTAFCDGCSGVTYTGQDLRANPNQKVIAVDPNVIPLGSRVYVEGYGEAIAGDIGSAIKGNRIDVFIPEHENAMAFGVQQLQIEILD